MFEKKKQQESIETVQPEPQVSPVSIIGEQKALMTEEMLRQIALNLQLNRREEDTYTRTEEVISPAITRFIDIFDKDEETGTYRAREDDFGNPLDLMGALGNIPPSQMPYIALSNFMNIFIKLREGIYLDVYEVDKKTGQLKLDESGNPILKFTKVISLGAYNRKLQLLANLAYEQNRAKLQAQTMVGNAGGSPLGVGGSWDDTLQLLFGGGARRKQ